MRRKTRAKCDGDPGAADRALECPLEVTMTREPESPTFRVLESHALHDGGDRAIRGAFHAPAPTRGMGSSVTPVGPISIDVPI